MIRHHEYLCQISHTGLRSFPVKQLCEVMQGDCSDAPPAQVEVRGVPLLPVTPGQCLLVADTTIFTLGVGRLWLHNLYLRHTATQVSDPVVWLVRAPYENSEAQLWMTSCTLQGHGQYESGFGAFGLYLSSKAYVEGWLFSNHDGTRHAMSGFQSSCCCLLYIALANAAQQVRLDNYPRGH